MGTETPGALTEVVAGAIRAARTVARGPWRDRWIAWAEAWLVGGLEPRSAARAKETAEGCFAELSAPCPEDEWEAVWVCLAACHAALELDQGWPAVEQYARNVELGVKRLRPEGGPGA